MKIRLFALCVTGVLWGCTTFPPDENPSLPDNEFPTSFESRAPTAEELRNRGMQQLEEGNLALAEKTFHAALKMNEKDYESELGLAECLLKQGKSDKASMHFKNILSAPEHKAVALQGIGLAALQRSNYQEAEESLSLAIAENSTLWRSWNGLGQIHDIQNDWDSAQFAYEKALEYTPKKEVIYNNIGMSYLAKGDNVNAAEAFDKALGFNPDLEAAKTNQKLALARMNRYDEAVIEGDVYAKAKALNNVGYAAMMQGDYEKAERLFLKSLEIYPSFYKAAYDNLQVLHHLKGENESLDLGY